MDIKSQIRSLVTELPGNVTLVAVSKTHTAEDIMQAYKAGQRVFGESRPQELKAKYEALPKDIRWHMIGHLQTNKVKYIAPFVELIHSVDSDKLLGIIDREAAKNNRTIDVLLEIFIAKEETKHGWEPEELKSYLNGGKFREYTNVRFRGVMGIATYTDNTEQIKSEFDRLKKTFGELQYGYFGKEFDIISMGMTSDYGLAVERGSNMVRIGSLIFGERDYA